MVTELPICTEAADRVGTEAFGTVAVNEAVFVPTKVSPE